MYILLLSHTDKEIVFERSSFKKHQVAKAKDTRYKKN